MERCRWFARGSTLEVLWGEKGALLQSLPAAASAAGHCLQQQPECPVPMPVSTLAGCISAAGLVSTVAGAAGQRGSSDGPGAVARFNEPKGIAAAPDGSLYVADCNNNAIRHISAEGTVSTLAGGQQGALDGLGPAARFFYPSCLSLGSDGSLYVGNYSTVRRIT